MLWAVSILSAALWGLGLASGAVLGAWVHLLLGVSLLALVLAVAQAAAGGARPSARSRP